MNMPALSQVVPDIFAVPVCMTRVVMTAARALWVLPSIALNLLLIAEAGALPVIDQQQPTIDATVGALVIGGGSSQKLAQTVTTGISGLLTAVRVPIAGDSGDLILEIQDVAAGEPNGVVLASAEFAAATLPIFFPAPPSFRTLLLTVPIAFSSGDAFAIVLHSLGAFAVFQGPPGDSYAGGNLFFDALPNPPGWVCTCEFAGASFDLPFQTLVDSAVPEPSVLAFVASGLSAFISLVVRRNRRMDEVESRAWSSPRPS